MKRSMCGFLFVIFMLGIGFLQVPGARGTTPDDTLVIGYNRISNNLHPGMTTALPNIWANMLLYDALVIHDFEGKVHPSLAKRWETSKDGLTWTFYLRDDVKFHSGRKFTARDVKAHFDNWKTFPSVSCSFCESSLEKAGSSTVITGITKKVTINAKFSAT